MIGIRSDENNHVFTRHTISQGERGMGERKVNNNNPEMRQQRRALRIINQNFVGSQPYPCIVNKRAALSEKHSLCDENPDPVQHRPITRKFAKTISSTQQQHPFPQDHCKQSVPISNSKGLEDCIFIDVEECKEATDVPVPMALEQSSEKVIEVNHMDEVEMEDIDEEEEPIMDIDGRDTKNQLAVVDYVEDIYAYYRRMEKLSCVSPDYMGHQHDINERMRAILIDWLIEVHDKFELMNETLFLTVNLIDRFLAQQTVVRKKLQLVGLVAMLLACKYEEVAVPVVGDLILISDKAYTRQEFIDMERLMLNTLQFNMSLPTPYVFVQRFLKAAQSDKKLEVLTFFLIELCLVEYEMLKFPPSLLAASAIYTAQCTLYGFRQWNKTCEWHTNYLENHLQECSRLIVNFHQQAATGKLTGVHRKYCQSKFGCAAKCEAAKFLMESNHQ